MKHQQATFPFLALHLPLKKLTYSTWKKLPLIEKCLYLTGVLLILFALFGGNHLVELRAEEPRRAIVSMEMALSGEYLIPKINAWSYYNKPPVFNWVMVLFFKIFGSFDEWVVRLPSVLAYLATAIVHFFVVKRFLKTEVSLLSSLFFLSIADVLFYGAVNAGEIDLFFSFLVYLQVAAIFWFSRQEQFGRLFLFSYLLAAAGTLTKGPPSIAFQALTLLPWLLINRQWRALFSIKHFLGIAAYVAVVGGYFYCYGLYDDVVGFMVRLFKEAAQRTGMEHSFLDTLWGTAGFPFLLMKQLLPWSLLFVFMWRKDVLQVIRSNPFLQFCGVFILFNIPLYWFSGDHRARYLFMFFPFFCTLFAYLYLNVNTLLRRWKNSLHGLFFWAMVLVVLAFLVPPFIPQTSEVPFIFLKCLALVLTGTVFLYLYQKFPGYKIYIFVLTIFLVRIGFNFTYLPALASESSELNYRNHLQKVIDITGSNPVHWYGHPYTFESDASFGPITFKDVKLTSAPLLAYQIPYYLTKGNGHIMVFEPSIHSNQYYLAHERLLENKKVKVLYQFQDDWLNQKVILFRED